MAEFQPGFAAVLVSYPAVLVRILFAVLILCTLALLLTVVACVVRVRRRMRASDTALKDALEQIAREREATAEKRGSC